VVKVFPIDTPTQKYLEQPMVINTQQSHQTRASKQGCSPTTQQNHGSQEE